MAAQSNLQIVLAKPPAGPARHRLGTYRGSCELRLIRHPEVPIDRGSMLSGTQSAACRLFPTAAVQLQGTSACASVELILREK